MGDKDGSAPLCRLAPRCSPLREAIVDLRAFAVRAAAGRQARCGEPWGAKLAPAAHIFDVCVVYTVCTPAPVPSVPTREALMPVFAPCPDWLGGGSRLACNTGQSRLEYIFIYQSYKYNGCAHMSGSCVCCSRDHTNHARTKTPIGLLVRITLAETRCHRRLAARAQTLAHTSHCTQSHTQVAGRVQT